MKKLIASVLLVATMMSNVEVYSEALDLPERPPVKHPLAICAGELNAPRIEMNMPKGSFEKTVEEFPIQESLHLHMSEENELELFTAIKEKTGSEVLAAAMMGNAHRESRMCPYRWENDIAIDNTTNFPFSMKHTQKIEDLLDEKQYKLATYKFINMNPLNNWAGFGLYGFTARGHKQNLIEYCILNDYDLTDPIGQSMYVLYYIYEHHPDLYNELCNETHLYKCVKLFANKFEKCECSEQGIYDRCYWARYYFEKFAEGELLR